jgi:Dimerisation and cyclophilin-binding domain of Mon2
MQTLVMVVTWRSCEMSEETISQALTVCLSLHEAKNATVRHAAYMTIRQIIRYAVSVCNNYQCTLYVYVHAVYAQYRNQRRLCMQF